MRAVVQRATRASVTVDGQVVGGFDGQGLVVLLGVTPGDGPAQVDLIARKIAELRILRDERSAVDVGAPVLVVSQFTLYADVRKGRRPTWNAAAPGAVAEPLVDAVVAAVDGRRSGLTLARTSAQYFVSADNTVRFSVRNELSADAQVRVQTTPRKACLRTEPSDPVLVRAGSEELVTVSMHAIANCEVVVEAVLTGVDGVPLAEPVTFDVRATPTIESVGTAVVGVLLAVGLVLGVVRTVRRGQSARRGARRVDDEAGTRPLPVLGGTPEGDSR